MTVQARQLSGSFQAMGAICRVIPPVQFARPGRLNFSLLWASDFSGEPNDCGVFTKNLLSSCLSWLVLDGRYLSILYNNAWLDACTRHTFLLVRAGVEVACRRVLSTNSPTSLDRLQTIDEGRGVEITDPQILIALESPCLARLRGPRPPGKSILGHVFTHRGQSSTLQSHESICEAASCILSRCLTRDATLAVGRFGRGEGIPPSVLVGAGLQSFFLSQLVLLTLLSKPISLSRLTATELSQPNLLSCVPTFCLQSAVQFDRYTAGTLTRKQPR
jgi:hypothetical protein